MRRLLAQRHVIGIVATLLAGCPPTLESADSGIDAQESGVTPSDGARSDHAVGDGSLEHDASDIVVSDIHDDLTQPIDAADDIAPDVPPPQDIAPEVLTCPAGQTLCGTTCADTTSDANNCGGCGFACRTGQSCVSSVCSCYEYNCFDCTGLPNCGWCGATSTCMAGDSSGTGCASGWSWIYTTCGADPCAANVTCATCTAASNCGWCGTLATGYCATGTSNGWHDIAGYCTPWAWTNCMCPAS